MSNSRNIIFSSLMAALLMACGGQDQGSDSNTKQVSIDQSPSAGIEVGTQTLSFDLNVRSALAAGISASNAKVTITKGELERTQNINLQGDSASVSFTSLPIGEYQVAIQVMDGITVVAEGSGTASVNADTQSDISLVLNAVTGNLQVNLCMPDSGATYKSGSFTAPYEINTNIAEIVGYVDDPQLISLQSKLSGTVELSLSYRFGSGEVTQTPPPLSSILVLDKVNKDHGAELKIMAGSEVISTTSGCDTEVIYWKDGSHLMVIFGLPDYDKELSFQVDVIGGKASVVSAGLSAILVFTDENEDAFSGEISNINQIDMSKFEKVFTYIGSLRDFKSADGSGTYGIPHAYSSGAFSIGKTTAIDIQ